jgi:hypothetical protein
MAHGNSEMNQELRHFFTCWFSGWAQGLETLDAASRTRMLHACGKACAASYTLQVFREAKAASTDLNTFMQELSLCFPDARYEWDGLDTILVTYLACGCDLVRFGLVNSPLLCECSTENLKENFQAALGKPVSVVLESSILRGGAQCILKVTLGNVD